MKGFVQGVDRQQATLLPEYLDDWVDESNPVRAVDVFVDALELRDLGFDGVDPAATGRPGYHPSAMLKLYIFGYLNRVQSSRRLEREAGRESSLRLLRHCSFRQHVRGRKGHVVELAFSPWMWWSRPFRKRGLTGCETTAGLMEET